MFPKVTKNILSQGQALKVFFCKTEKCFFRSLQTLYKWIIFVYTRFDNLMNKIFFFRLWKLEFWKVTEEEASIKMNKFTLFLALAFCATLIWRTEAEECGPGDGYRCGNRCHGYLNTCTCGNESWTGKDILETRDWDQGCCPSSPDSCIKDKKGKKDSF